MIALTAMVTCGMMTAQAADQTLMLACEGTTTMSWSKRGSQPEPISMGIIVNFNDRTVRGFFDPGVSSDDAVKITALDDLTVAFSGSSAVMSFEMIIDGNIDRVTGDVSATYSQWSLQMRRVTAEKKYALKCKPAQRMF